MVKLVRYAVPAAIAIAGLAFLAFGEGGVAAAFGIVLIGVALLVALANAFARMTISSQRDRERERQSRERFTRTGRWTGTGQSGRR